jgi:predicted TIM-barrel fold metal-dependent hydrolase
MHSDIIDFHAHLPDGPEEVIALLRAYDRAGIARGVLVPGNMLDSRFLADFMRGQSSLRSSEPDNAALLRAASRSNGRLMAFFNADPFVHDPGDIVQAKTDGYRGFKFNPLVLRTDLKAPDTLDLVAKMASLKATLYTHITLQPQADLGAVVELAKRFRDLSIVIGHMGFATADMAALKAVRRHDNLYLETSIGSVLALRAAERQGLAGKLVFGSEYPLHDPEIELRKLSTVFKDKDLQLICVTTAARLIGEAP